MKILDFLNLSVAKQYDVVTVFFCRAGKLESMRSCFNSISKVVSYGNIFLVRGVFLQDSFQNSKIGGIAAVEVEMNLFRIVQLAELPFALFILGDGKGCVIRICISEEQKAPQLGIVDIYHAGRCPYPVVLRERPAVFSGALMEGAFFNVYFPLDAGEVQAVEIAGLRNGLVGDALI